MTTFAIIDLCCNDSILLNSFLILWDVFMPYSCSPLPFLLPRHLCRPTLTTATAVYLCVWRGERGKDETACEHKSMVEVSVLFAEGEG